MRQLPPWPSTRRGVEARHHDRKAQTNRVRTVKGTTTPKRLAKQLAIPKTRALEATIKAQLIAGVLAEVKRRNLTHADLATRAGLSRTTVTGMLSGSLQKITIDRVLRLVEAAGLEAKLKLRRAA